jgi:hypothetical protein
MSAAAPRCWAAPTHRPVSLAAARRRSYGSLPLRLSPPRRDIHDTATVNREGAITACSCTSWLVQASASSSAAPKCARCAANQWNTRRWTLSPVRLASPTSTVQSGQAITSSIAGERVGCVAGACAAQPLCAADMLALCAVSVSSSRSANSCGSESARVPSGRRAQRNGSKSRC